MDNKDVIIIGLVVLLVVAVLFSAGVFSNLDEEYCILNDERFEEQDYFYEKSNMFCSEKGMITTYPKNTKEDCIVVIGGRKYTTCIDENGELHEFKYLDS